MAGFGPPPKASGKRARRNTDPVPTKTIEFVPGEQPELPGDFDWHPQTHEWWSMWAESPLSSHFMGSDWSFLLDTAILHSKYWHGDMSTAAELRLRVAKFGQTPEDRMRLRITFADADEKDSRRPVAPSAKDTYGDLQAV